MFDYNQTLPEYDTLDEIMDILDCIPTNDLLTRTPIVLSVASYDSSTPTVKTETASSWSMFMFFQNDITYRLGISNIELIDILEHRRLNNKLTDGEALEVLLFISK